MLNSQWRELLESTADAAFVADSDGIIRVWNRAAVRLFGYPASEAVGRSCAELFEGRNALGSDVCRRDCAVLQSVSTGREIPDFDMETRTRDGSPLWVNISVIPCFDRRLRRRYSVHLMRDIGPRKKREELGEKLLHAAKDLVTLAAGHTQTVPVSPLSPQERKILRSLAGGNSPAATAARLQITPRTLRNHLHNINRKLGTRNRLAAVVHASQAGLI